MSYDPDEPVRTDSTLTYSDLQHLQLLSIFHYIVGGMSILCGCFPFIHVGMGIAMLSGAFDQAGQGGPPRELGWLFIAIGGAIILVLWTYGILVVVCGRKLSTRRNYWFCFVMACIECLEVPFGTVLGVFTIIVLLRPSVKARFGVT